MCACSPPPVLPLTLVALDIAGVEEIYRIGGAQAVAAMALGTGTIRPVQKIVGPGNVYVTAAKMLLRDHAEIDFPAGPSEIGVIADGTANPSFIAIDILAQAEHDPDAACVLVTTDAALAEKVGQEVGRLCAESPRKDIIERALSHSGYVIAPDMHEAVSMMDRIAPEHLLDPGRRPSRCPLCRQACRFDLCRALHAGRCRGLRVRHEPRPAHGRLCQDVLGAERLALLQVVHCPDHRQGGPRGDR